MDHWEAPPAETEVGYAQEEIPSSRAGSVFLAGPTPRDPEVPSWRPDAVEVLRGRWAAAGTGRLVVFVPETREGGVNAGWDAQVEWEDACLNACDVIAFWVPRDMRTLPGLTTNVEWGRWESSGKVVLGAPAEAPRNRYLFHYARRHGVPTAATLEDTMDAALELLRRRRPQP
jgi:hypothetical protein